MDHIVKPFATRDALSHSLHRLNEDYESLKAENAELREEVERLNKKADDWYTSYLSKEATLKIVKEQNDSLEQEVERLKEENASISFERNLAQIEVHNLRAKLSRYESAIKVEGIAYVLTPNSIKNIIMIYPFTEMPKEYDTKRVTVLVLPRDEK